MSSHNFEGEFQELSIKQIRFIQDVLQKRGFKENKVLFAPVGKVGDNYAANVKRITVEVENGDNFSMIAKIASTVEFVREMNMQDVLFGNETIMYTEVLPKFVSMQKAAGVPEQDVIKYAECYGSLTEPPHEVILLEDLKPKNFGMLDRTQPLPQEAVKMIFKNFAILHSMSFVLKKQDPEMFKTFKNKIINIWSIANERPENEMMAKKIESEICNLLDNEEHKMAIQKAIRGSISATRKAMNRDKDSKYSVIIQGDGWTNNIMFQITDEVIKQCSMIDYQISREANPVCDILYMLYSCTDHETRMQYFQEWLNFYYDELDRSLSNFGIKASNVYPRDLLDADARWYTKVYLVTALYLLNVFLRTTDEAAEMKNAMSDDYDKISESIAISTLSSETASLYKSRIEGLMNTCKELGFL